MWLGQRRNQIIRHDAIFSGCSFSFPFRIAVPLLCAVSLRFVSRSLTHSLYQSTSSTYASCAFTDHCCIDTPTLPHFKIRFYCNLLLKHKLFLPFFSLFIFTHSLSRSDREGTCMKNASFAARLQLFLFWLHKKKRMHIHIDSVFVLFSFFSSRSAFDMRARLSLASFGVPEFSLGPNVFPIDAEIWERTNDVLMNLCMKTCTIFGRRF